MNIDHDSRRDLERHALRNVSWLAEKLGYRDALDRRQEKVLILAMAVGVAIAIVALGLSATMQDTSAQDLERHRCEVEMRVQSSRALRIQVMNEHPKMAVADRDRIFEEKMHAMMAPCSGKSSSR